MRQVGLVAIAVVVVVGTGCLLPSLDDLGGNGAPGDAASPDATTIDAAPDASSDGPAGPFCQRLSPKPTFCADFDQGDFPAGFDSVTTYGSGKSLLEGPLGDPSRAFSASSPAISGSTQGAAALVKKLAKPIKQLRIEFDYLPVALDSSERSICSIAVGKDNLNLYVRNTGARVTEAATLPDGGTLYGGGTLAKGFTVGTKAHVKWVITVGAGTSASSVTLDGAAVEYDNVHVHDYPSPPQISIGMFFIAAPSPGWSARIDDVVFDDP
jgi:hypothetical protein